MNDNVQTRSTATTSSALASECALRPIPMVHELGVMIERVRQAAYDEGYADGVQATRQDAEAQQ